jgi:hypothetical protein
MTVTRLTGGLTPGDGADPRTFPAIFNATADEIEAQGTAIAGKAPLFFLENVQTGNYTLTLTDVAKVVAVDSSSASTVTVPANSAVAFPLGSVLNVYRAGTGGVAIAGAAGVTVRNAGSVVSQYAERSLRKRDTNEWVLV